MNVSPAIVAPAAIQAPPVQSPATIIWQQRPNVRRKSFVFEPRVTTTSLPSSDGRARFVVAASKSPNEDANSNSNSNADDPDLSFTSQDDLNFLLKLLAGSISGAAAIKYGSILVPEITQPNITQALIMISTPVIASVFILIKESRVKQ